MTSRITIIVDDSEFAQGDVLRSVVEQLTEAGRDVEVVDTAARPRVIATNRNSGLAAAILQLDSLRLRDEVLVRPRLVLPVIDLGALADAASVAFDLYPWIPPLKWWTAFHAPPRGRGFRAACTRVRAPFRPYRLPPAFRVARRIRSRGTARDRARTRHRPAGWVRCQGRSRKRRLAWA